MPNHLTGVHYQQQHYSCLVAVVAQTQHLQAVVLLDLLHSTSVKAALADLSPTVSITVIVQRQL
jgi:hypothetical protein